MTVVRNERNPIVPANARNRFTVPVYPHVKKFILKTYHLSDTIKVEEYNVIGMCITKTLRDNTNTAENNDQFRERLTATIDIVLTKRQSELSPRLNKLMRINIDLDRIFKDHLLLWIYALRTTGIPPYTACRMFLEYFEVDEHEYSLEAAYRYYQRVQKGLKEEE